MVAMTVENYNYDLVDSDQKNNEKSETTERPLEPRRDQVDPDTAKKMDNLFRFEQTREKKLFIAEQQEKNEDSKDELSSIKDELKGVKETAMKNAEELKMLKATLWKNLDASIANTLGSGFADNVGKRIFAGEQPQETQEMKFETNQEQTA